MIFELCRLYNMLGSKLYSQVDMQFYACSGIQLPGYSMLDRLAASKLDKGYLIW